MNDRIKRPSVSLVIPVYNEERHLKACLDSVAAQTVPPDEVIVVDNNSTNRTAETARSYPFVKLLYEKRQGVAFANATGMDAAANAIVGRIDADTRLSPDWIRRLTEYLAQHPQVVAVVGKTYFYDFPWPRFVSASHASIYHRLQKLIAGTDILWASNMAIRREAWQTIRPLVHMQTDVNEDVDMSLVLHQCGMRIRRYTGLHVGVSLLRGNLRPSYLAAYLHSWPHNYYVNSLPTQAVLIRIVRCFVLAVTWPIAAIHSTFRKSDD